MPATLNAFSSTSFNQLAFGIETQTYTFGPVTLGTGETQIFSVQNWNSSDDDIQKVVILEEIAAGPSDANVQVYWTADSQQSNRAQGWLDGYPPQYLPLDVYTVAAKNMALYVNNNRGSTLANFQLNYTVTVMNFSLFQRLLWGFAENPADTAAIQTLQDQENTIVAQKSQATGKNVQPKNVQNEIQALLKSGARPFSFEDMYSALFANRRKNNPNNANPFHEAVPSGASKSNGTNITVPNGYISILRGVWLNSASTGMNLMIDRDKNTSLVDQLNAPAFVRGDYLPLRFFLPFKDHVNAYVNGTSGTTYPVRLDIQNYQQSDLLMGHLWIPGYIKPKIQIGLQ